MTLVAVVADVVADDFTDPPPRRTPWLLAFIDVVAVVADKCG
ncbi:hypothetical protein [Mesosutterella porci]|nr:hypothetical protein [Mesosutterella sp. oilRF-744-WT-GAM-9]